MSSPKILSFVIPIYNEAAHLTQFLALIDQFDVGIEKELVFVDDGSTDGSVGILENYAFRSVHQLIKQPRNIGKGAALRTGISAAAGNFICIQDADFEYDVRDLPSLIAPLLTDTADIVYGSRFRKDGPQVHRTFHYLVNRCLTLFSNLCSGLYLSDMETCYKIFRAEILKSIALESNRFGFEPEITAKIARLRVRVSEVAIRYFPRNYLEGKKISWKDGLAALWHIIHYNFASTPSQYILPSMPDKYRLSKRAWL